MPDKDFKEKKEGDSRPVEIKVEELKKTALEAEKMENKFGPAEGNGGSDEDNFTFNPYLLFLILILLILSTDILFKLISFINL